MCGLVGFLSADVSSDPAGLLRKMAGRISHRGPDADGVWSHPQLGVAFAHRRLSIQDLSPLGAQPMTSTSGRYTIVFNGEIYNFLELRIELEAVGFSFRGHSDTEVMLACFEHWGVEQSLSRLVGMFAFAVCDLENRTVILARDRLGEKPLYYGWQGNTFFFGSELKSFKPHPAWKGEINRDALTLLLRHNYIPAPHSIYKDIFKLPPASWLEIRLNGKIHVTEPQRYWKLEHFYQTQHAPLPLKQRADELEVRLKAAVKQQMVADVPLGAFLSGGIDSSTIVALMQSQSARPVKTFSIGFNEAEFNEAEHAKAVAQHLKTEHTELYVTPQHALDVIPRLPHMYDEPFADSSQIPTYLVCEMTRKHVTVALSGDGGDELFGGYERFFSTARSWSNLERKRGSAVEQLKSAVLSLPSQFTAPLIKTLAPSQRHLSSKTIQEKIARTALMRSSKDLQQFYRTGISFWFEPENIVLGGREPTVALAHFPVSDFTSDPFHQMMLLDSLSYLPDDILVKVDRAAMACSLETRVPLLDHRVVEYAAGIPSHENVSGDKGKLLLREVLYRHVPKEMIERPKKGFAVPVAAWLRGPLQEWAESLMSRTRLQSEGFFNVDAVRHKWEEHQRGRVDHSFFLWGILSFQAWLDYQKNENRI